MGVRRTSFRLSVLPALTLLVLFPPGLGAQELQPVAIERVLGLLGASQRTEVILGIFADERCRAFDVDAEAERRLREAGAEEDLIRGLRGVHPCSVEPEPAEEEPAVPVATRVEAPQSRSEPLFSPSSAALRSLAIPGLGQFYTGKPALGGLFLAGWAGAIGFGLASQEVTVECLAPATDTCPAGQVRAETVERPMLIVGLAAAAGVAVVSAIHARSAANSANAERRGFNQDPQTEGPILEILPARQPPRSNQVVLLRLRF